MIKIITLLFISRTPHGKQLGENRKVVVELT
jgi:hypothetical protein